MQVAVYMEASRGSHSCSLFVMLVDVQELTLTLFYRKCVGCEKKNPLIGKTLENNIKICKVWDLHCCTMRKTVSAMGASLYLCCSTSDPAP